MVPNGKFSQPYRVLGRFLTKIMAFWTRLKITWVDCHISTILLVYGNTFWTLYGRPTWMANMWSEYVKGLFLDTFLHHDSKTVCVFLTFWRLEVDPPFFTLNFFLYWIYYVKFLNFMFLAKKLFLRYFDLYCCVLL